MNTRSEQALANEAPAVSARWDRFIACNDVGCPGCGYNLRGLEGRRCPECGGRIDPAALMFAGQDELSVGAIVRHTGVVGALVFAIVVHAVATTLMPGLYGHFVVAGATQSGIGSLDLILSSALLVVAGFAWAYRRAGEKRLIRGGADEMVQRGAALVCWALAAVKAGLIGSIMFIGLLVL